jgi:hypothetical protein
VNNAPKKIENMARHNIFFLEAEYILAFKRNGRRMPASCPAFFFRVDNYPLT